MTKKKPKDLTQLIKAIKDFTSALDALSPEQIKRNKPVLEGIGKTADLLIKQNKRKMHNR